MRFEKLTQTIAAGGAWRLGMAAAELQIVDSSYPLRVTLYRGGAVIGSGLNVLAGDYFRGVDFDFVELFSVAAQDVTILLSDGVSGSNRIVGEVSVIRGEMARVKSGVSFLGYSGAAATTAAYSVVQLWNPAASGKNIVLNGFLITSNVLQQARCGWMTAAILALQGAGKSKFLGGADSAMECRNENPAAAPGVNYFAHPQIPAGLTNFVFFEPLIIPPGVGFTVVAELVNTTITVTADYLEDPI